MRIRQFVSSDFWCQGDRPWYPAFGVSMLLHCGLIIVLGSLWLEASGLRETAGVDTRWSGSKTIADQSVAIEPDEEIEKPTDNETADANAGTVLFQARSQKISKIAEPKTQTVSVADFSGTFSESTNFAEEVGEALGNVNDILAGQFGLGEGKGNAEGDGTGGNFFGVNASGERFVFVVDSSRSMNHPHASEAKTRFRRLKLELVKSVVKMTSDQKFFIIFFNSSAIPMPARTLQSAFRDNQKRYLNWITKVRADGDTDPRSALKLALRLQPDVIYFLTDGDIVRPIALDLESIVQSTSAIHTFAFGNRAGEEMLKKIAANNRGRYQYVP